MGEKFTQSSHLEEYVKKNQSLQLDLTDREMKLRQTRNEVNFIKQNMNRIQNENDNLMEQLNNINMGLQQNTMNINMNNGQFINNMNNYNNYNYYSQ